MQIKSAVECGLTTHGGQYRIGLLGSNNALYYFPSNRFDVGHIGHLRIGHDGRWIAVDQNDAIALFTQGFTCLRA